MQISRTLSCTVNRGGAAAGSVTVTLYTQHIRHACHRRHWRHTTRGPKLQWRRMSQNRPRICLFCANPLEDRAKEHVIPVWLQQRLGITEDRIALIVAETETHRIFNRRQHAVDQHLEGRICASCNNGWMSDLETDAVPLLTALLDRQKDISSLDLREKLLFARWAAKTAFMMNSASAFDRRVPADHFVQLYRSPKRLPGGVFVLAQQHRHTAAFNIFQFPNWDLVGLPVPESKLIDDALATAYKIGFQLGSLLVAVGFFSIRRYVLYLRDGVHVCLSPLLPRVRWRNQAGTDFPWDDSLAALQSFVIDAGLSLEDSKFTAQ